MQVNLSGKLRTGYEKPHPEAYRRVPRTLDDEVEALRRVIRTGREEIRVPDLCFSHGDQENPPKVSQPVPGRCLHADTNRRGGDMTGNTRVPKAEITGVYGALLKKVSRKMLGEVPEGLGVMWHNRPVLKASLAEAMSQTPPTVTDELSARLLEQLGAPAMVELTAWVAFANQAARTNVALGIEAQGFSATCGLAPLAQPSGEPSGVASPA
jgi:alkylhydroperoxidase family enzyme